MRTFCTYFDSRYLARGLALHDSLSRHSPGMTLWVLCLDRQSERALQALNLTGVRPITLLEIEEGDRELLNVKGSRSPLEYYFTLTPSLPLYVMGRDPDVDLVTY